MCLNAQGRDGCEGRKNNGKLKYSLNLKKYYYR